MREFFKSEGAIGRGDTLTKVQIALPESDFRQLFSAGNRAHAATSVMPSTSAARFQRILLCCILLLLIAYTRSAHPVDKPRQHSASPEQPVIQQTDPPNWWSGLPNPMLLMHGKNLSGARVSTNVQGIVVQRTHVSKNGDWLFVWLDISSAPPQRFNLLVRTAVGSVRVPYELNARHSPADGFRGFNSSDVMYLIMTDRFSDGDPSNDHLQSMPGTFDRTKPRAYHGGDLRGIDNHLDYIQQLGATTIWITPLYAQDPNSAADYHGYGAVDMYAVNPHFGTLQDYADLALDLHHRGMKLVLDTVPNHVGPKNPWVLDPPAPDWFHGTLAKHLEANGNFAPMTDPHAPPAAYRKAVNGWFANVLPDLNQSNPLVDQYLIQNAIWWIESGTLDGLRLDTFPYVDRAFWRDFHAELHTLYPNLTTVGEIFNPDPTIVSYFAGGATHEGIDTGLYTPFDFPTYFALRETLTETPPASEQPITQLENVQRQDWLYPHPERLVTFLGNHDTTRFISEPGATEARMKLAFGLLATMRGMPQIYYGDEIGMPGGKDPDNRHDFPGGFLGDAKDGFTAEGRTPAQESMHAWVQGLLQLRAHHPVLQTGAQQDLLVDDTGMVFARVEGPPPGKPLPAIAQGEIVLVLLNKATTARTFRLDFSDTALAGIHMLTPLWNGQSAVVTRDQSDITVDPEQLVVLEAQR
jgi:neopullulanase